MELRNLLVLLTIIVVLSGCHAVTSDQPVGDEAYPISKPDWNGLWLNEDGVVHFQVLNEAEGIIRIAFVESEDDTLKFESGEVLLRRHGDQVIANMKLDEDCRYYWGRIQKNESQLIFWEPEFEKIKKLLKTGRIGGELDDNEITLRDITPAQLDLLFSEEEEVYFNWDEPLVLIRLFD